MKRCSECEFIYEDDQTICDMDGHELVVDPAFNASTNATTRSSDKTSKRRLVLTAAAASIVGALLVVGYSGLTSDNVRQTTKAPTTDLIRTPRSAPAQVPAAPEAVPPAAPDSSPTPEPNEPQRLEKGRGPATSAAPLVNSEPGPRSTMPPRRSSRSTLTKANHKKDSGIKGFIKKTGKVLKRPFKF
jgi:hypothetical protein